MNLRIVPLLLALGLPLSVAGPTAAERVVVEKSEIKFVSKQMGVSFEGKFRKWNAVIDFRPKDLVNSKAEFAIDLVSIDLASADSENEAKDKMWFDMARFPVARFASSSIRSKGGDNYEVVGRLTMKGVGKDILVPIVLKKDGSGNSVAEGSFVLNRLEFKIGEGLWSDTDTIAAEVVVRVRMVLVPG